MESRQHGLLETEPLQEVDEDVVAEVDLNNSVSEEEREEIQTELAKLEEEIAALKQVLAAKEKHHAELKLKLGMNPLNDLKQNVSKSWHEVQTSTAYKKTQETLSTAGQKATAALSNVGTAISRKLGDMRNSPSFRSFEEKVESTVSTLKTKVGGSSSSRGSFEEVLSSTAHASAQDPPVAVRLLESGERTC